MDKLKFFVQNIQSVLFIENFAFRNKLGIASKINNCVSGLFDGDPTMLDIPPNAPPEIPRILLKDSVPNYSLNFSPIRLDFFYNEPQKPERILDALKDDYFRYLFSIAALVKDEYRLTVTRVAIILKTLSETEKSSNLLIHENFLAKRPFFKDTHSLEIHALEKTTMNGYGINRWFRIKTERKEPMGEDNFLLVEIDVNTLPEKPRDFSLEEIKHFFSKSIDLIKTNFSNCFGASL